MSRKLNIWAGGAVVGDTAVNTFNRESLRLYNSSGASLLVVGGKDPDLSPDGTKLVIEKFPGYTYTCNVDGTGLAALSPTVGGGWEEPKWFPDGSGVICTHGVGGGVQEYFKIDYPSGTTHQITSDASIPFKWRPSVASDGVTVCATIGPDFDHSSVRKFTLPAVLGSPMITAADMTTLIPFAANAPSYDGEFNLAMDRICFDRSGSVWTAGADGSNPKRIALGLVPRFNRRTGDVWFWWWSGSAAQKAVGPAPYAQSVYSIQPDGLRLNFEYYCNVAESICVQDVA